MRILIVTAACLMSAALCPASIITYTTSFTIGQGGTTTFDTTNGVNSNPDGVDFYDFFGGGNLIGQTATISFAIDTSLASAGQVSGAGTYQAYFGTVNNAVTNSVTINGHTFSSTSSTTGSLEYGVIDCIGSTTIVPCNGPTVTGYEVDILTVGATYPSGFALQVELGTLTDPIPVASMYDPTTVVTSLNAGYGWAGVFLVNHTCSNCTQDEYFETSSSSSAPEPSSFVMLSAGLCLLWVAAGRVRRPV